IWVNSYTKVTTPLLAKAVANIMSANFFPFPDVVISSERKKSLAEEKNRADARAGQARCRPRNIRHALNK
ncbi:hypothetical protein, partial [Aeromonas caviae]|uniref:hypothetical protein n=1 Tax=Aeromonas caviae TaxID=648 RepID=UPI001F388301